MSWLQKTDRPIKITLIDDFEDALDFLDYNLSSKGYQTASFSNSRDAIRYIKPFNTDLVITDFMMPGLDGLEIVSRLKSNLETNSIPVIMVTCIDDEDRIADAFHFGVEDYLTKPFKPKELIARVERTVNRTDKTKDELVTLSLGGGVELDKSNFQVKRNQTDLGMTISEFKLLELLSSRPNMVFTRSEIQDYVSGSSFSSTDRAVDVMVVSLRKKLKDRKAMVETVRSIGYKLNLDQ